jgi:hypothetical protein
LKVLEGRELWRECGVEDVVGEVKGAKGSDGGE